MKNKLIDIVVKKQLKTWKEISEYIRRFKKYDAMTLRDIDDVLFIAKQNY